VTVGDLIILAISGGLPEREIEDTIPPYVYPP
jgi:hypothetical protein